MSRYYDIKQSLSYHFVLPTPDIKGVLSAALTIAILFHKMCLLYNICFPQPAH